MGTESGQSEAATQSPAFAAPSIEEACTHLTALLADGLAHKFNNMLVPIVCNSSFIRSDLDQSHPWHREIEQICTEADRMSVLNHLVLTFIRGCCQGLRAVSLGRVFTGDLPLAAAAVASRVEIFHEVEAADDRIMADPHVLRHILLHGLLGSALSMPCGGKLHIAIRGSAIPAGIDIGDAHGVLLSIHTAPGPPKPNTAPAPPRVYNPDCVGFGVLRTLLEHHPGDFCIERRADQSLTLNMYFPRPSPESARPEH